MKKTIKIPELLGCARCGGNHRRLVFKALTRPIDQDTHWCPCPNNGQPILLKYVQTGVAVKPFFVQVEYFVKSRQPARGFYTLHKLQGKLIIPRLAKKKVHA